MSRLAAAGVLYAALFLPPLSLFLSAQSFLCCKSILPYALFVLCISESRDLSFCPFSFLSLSCCFASSSFFFFFSPIAPNVPLYLFSLFHSPPSLFYSSTLYGYSFCFLVASSLNGKAMAISESRMRRAEKATLTPYRYRYRQIPRRIHNKHAGNGS